MKLLNKIQTEKLRHSLKLKTSLIAVSVILFSMMLCGWLLTGIVEEKLKEETLHSAELNAELVVRHLDDQFAYMQQAYYSILFDSQIQNWLLHPELDPFYRGMQEKVNTVLLTGNGNVFSVYIKNFLNDRIYTTDYLTWQSSNGYGGTVTPSSFTSPVLITQTAFSNSDISLISLVGQIHQGDFGDPLAWLSINVQKASFSNILRDDSFQGDFPLLLTDQNGAVISTGRSEFPDDLISAAYQAVTGDTIIYDGETYLVVAAQTNNYQWQYRKLFPESWIFSEVYRLRTILMVILLGFSVLVFLGLYQVLNYITNPIYDLSNLVRSYRQSQKWSGTFHTDRKDEFAYLYQSLQDMTERIDHLIDQEYKAQLYKKETQLRIFRNGINPHFLYNILDSLLWTIKFGEYERAEQILQNFSVFLHHVLSSNKEFVSVRSVHEEICTFCELSSFLKDDSIRWSVEFSSAALEWNIPSFFIQPLAENCFKHAFKGREEGTLRITGDVQDAELVFCVEDDGVGMTQEQCTDLLAYLNEYDFDKESAHFGLASVHQRLKLYYGPEYGLEIQTEPGKGTSITLRLPLSRLNRTQEN